MSKWKILIQCASLSGNTLEVAELIKERLERKKKWKVDIDRIYLGMKKADYSSYDAVILGSYTWGKGELPEEMLPYFHEDHPIKESLVYVYGTGDTQFGGDGIFCNAADLLAKHFDSPIYPLKIEQSPRGSQEKIVKKWTKRFRKSLKDISKEKEI